MKTPVFITFVCFAAVLHFPAAAQEAAAPEWFKKLDRNGDGKITREEMPRVFEQVDSDKDGTASVAELTAHFSKGKPATPAPSAPAALEKAGRPPEEVFEYLDADADGKLSVSEFGGLSEAVTYFKEHPEQVAAIFKKFDADGNGSLSLDELRAFIERRQPAAPAPKPDTAPAKPSAHTAPAASAADIAFFEKSIRPVLVKNCYDCHSAEAKELKAGLASYEADDMPKKFATYVVERAAVRDSELFLRGEVEKPADKVPRGLPMLAKNTAPIASGSGRQELADWIASPKDPLTARVLVNRVWLHLFGQGLVTTPDNFGISGQTPSHPALLDHLAARFVREGWSMKKLIRELMTSRTYALGTAQDAKNFEADPDNTLLWRMTPRRLDAESVRDAMLLTAGKLDLTPPRGSAVATYGDGYVAGVQTQARGALDQIPTHRSVYLPVIRNAPLESLVLFDMSAASVVTGQRPQTTVPAQSLYLLNSPYMMKMAEFAAQRLLAERPNDDTARVTLAYQRIFSRPPTESEIRSALDFISTKPDAQSGWLALCQAMWASHEFLARG